MKDYYSPNSRVSGLLIWAREVPRRTVVGIRERRNDNSYENVISKFALS